MNAHFFSSLPGTSRFAGVVDSGNFHSAPDDWLIVMTDVCNSTRAVTEGRYKDVNMIGGAAICAVRNATGVSDWPFVFGGDGSTLLIDPACRQSAESALIRTRNLARDDFGLELRIAFVPVRHVRERGRDVLVARLEVSPGNDLALFGGGGVELADELVKNPSTAAGYLIGESELTGLPDLTGLSCRWEPLRSRHGRILCLLISARANSFDKRQLIMARVMEQLTRILGQGFSQANPVQAESLRLRWPPRGLIAEARATRGNKSLLRRTLELHAQSLLQWALDRTGLKAGNYQSGAYRQQVQTNCDYCKFDDVLRMVLDCSDEQISDIRQLLEQMQAQAQIDFGLFETDQALMTCLVFDLESSQHLHFIDGDDGGFWSAARDYKRHATHPEPGHSHDVASSHSPGEVSADGSGDASSDASRDARLDTSGV